jgi:hypothetical protein
MASFSASDVALTGFRIARERPKIVAIWAAIQFVIGLGFGLVTVRVAGPAFTAFTASRTAGRRDPAQALAMFHQMAPFYLLAILFALIFYPILFATMDRAVLQPDDEGTAYIRLGADELRQLGLILILAVIGFVAYVVVLLAVIIVVAILSAMFGVHPGAQPGLGASLGFGLVIAAAVMIILGAWLYVWIRLSLASPLTFATRRINVFGSWALTRGQFWPMFGAYIVAFVLALIVSLLTLVISLAVAAAAGGVGGLAGLMHPDMSSIAAWLTPARMINLVIQSISTALVIPILLTPAPAIYRSLSGQVDPSVAST